MAYIADSPLITCRRHVPTGGWNFCGTPDPPGDLWGGRKVLRPYSGCVIHCSPADLHPLHAEGMSLPVGGIVLKHVKHRERVEHLWWGCIPKGMHQGGRL